MSHEHFHLSVSHFPAATKDLFPKELILKHGCLALGFKNARRLFGRTRRLLNVGFVDPADETAVREVESIVDKTKAADGIQRFRINPEEMVLVLTEVYGLPRESLTSVELTPRLRSALEKPISSPS